ncbi:MAG TPA: ribosome maturation factor RimM [Chitinophagales bacterium]|jgi:16S rRNA processing protein RimM|nr:ribosome maturation factor RimM [Chitinophagales bacterium]HNL06419.1 ribosome maturation factor RimM [Chitinophagales bacterium]
MTNKSKQKHLQYIGTVVQSKGLKGEIKIAFEPDFMTFLDYQQPTHLYIANKMAKVPYFVQAISKPDGKGLYTLSLEEVDSKEMAEQLNRKEVFFETKLLEKFWDEHPELEEEDESWDFLIGYTLIDSDDNRIGTIANIYSVGESELASVEYQGREVLVPLHESLVVLLDEDEEILVMELPEGILEL